MVLLQLNLIATSLAVVPLMFLYTMPLTSTADFCNLREHGYKHYIKYAIIQSGAL